MEFILLPIFVALFVLVFLTYRIKNKYLRWACIILPPFSLVPLAWIPRDIGTVLIALPAVLAMLFSAGSIIVNIAVAIDRMARRRRAALRRLAVRLIRPALVVCIYFLAVSIVELSMESADIYAVELGRRIQSACDANGVCPEAVKEWGQSDDGLHTCEVLYGRYTTKYPIWYSASEDGNDFKIMVRHNIDEALYVTGGVNKDLRVELSIEDSIREIDANDLTRD